MELDSQRRIEGTIQVNCPGCQRSIDVDAMVCHHCQLQLREVCGQCHRGKLINHAYCPHCGAAKERR
jgi:hypothetical protein